MFLSIKIFENSVFKKKKNIIIQIYYELLFYFWDLM
jgi:hypothetical protein